MPKQSGLLDAAFAPHRRQCNTLVVVGLKLAV
jgi:hypothetical protein